MDNENSRNFNVTAKATASQKENYRKKAEQEGLSLSEWIVTVLDLYIEGHEAKGEPKQELPKTEVDWSKFPKATQLKLKMQKLHKKIINGFQEEPKQDLEKEMFELEEQLDIPSHLRWHNSKPKQETTFEEAKAKLFRYSEQEVYHILCEHTAELFKGSKMTLTEWFDKVKKK